MRLAFAIVCGVAESIRETLPSTEDEASAFVAGMAWAFAMFWTCLVLVTLLWAKWHGVAV